MTKVHVKKGDNVVVITGKDAGKEGKVLAVDTKKGKVVVEKVAVVSKHNKPTQANPQGGINRVEAFIDASNVMIYCDKCKKAYAAQPETDWKDFRLQSTANLFNTLAAEIRRHGLLAACAVFPTPELASRMVHQDWSRFQADLVLPMVYHSFYNESADWAAEMTATGIQQSQNRLPVAPGVHIPDIEAASLPAQLESLCTAGASGIGIFSSDELTPEHLKSIQAWLSGKNMPR